MNYFGGIFFLPVRMAPGYSGRMVFGAGRQGKGKRERNSKDL